MKNKISTKTLIHNVEAWEMFLLKLRYKDTRMVKAAGNKPILLDDPNMVWLVHSGQLHLFSVPFADGQPVGARSHLIMLRRGAMIFSTPLQDQRGLIATSSPETELMAVPLDALQEMVNEGIYISLIALLIEQWINTLAHVIPQTVSPKDYHPLDWGQNILIPAGSVYRPRKGVFWVQPITGRSLLAGREDVPSLLPGEILPLSSAIWLQAVDDLCVNVLYSEELLATGEIWTQLINYQTRLLQCINLNAAQREAAEIKRLHEKDTAEGLRLESALQTLASPLSQHTNALLSIAADKEGDLLNACQMIGRYMQMRVKAPLPTDDEQKRDPLQEIARASRFRIRKVALTDNWWHQDNGALLAYQGEVPVALIPARRGYNLLDPLHLVEIPVTQEVAESLNPFAFTFYRPLPERPLTAMDLLRYSLWGTELDWAALFLAGISGGLLALMIPLATSVIFNSFIPANDEQSLLLLVIVLLASVIAAGLFQLIRATATLRLEGRVDGSLQAAIWDRLLNLPVPFFRDYAAGDLATRAMGISIIRQMLSGIVINAVLSSIFSIFSLFLLFYYDTGLAMMAFGMVMLVMSVTLLIGTLQVRQQRRLVRIEGKITSMVLEFINGISKFRVAGAEDRAFAYWAKRFADKKKIAYRIRSLQNWLVTFNAAYPILTLAVIFGAVGSYGKLSTGDFLAFNVAFGQLITAGVMFSTAVITIFNTFPLYERIKPILAAAPEVTDVKVDPGELSGEIEVNRVSFRYRPTEPLILQDVSLQISPGEFVAVVGPSGSGKSTLFRLLLGMEKPDAGAIYYDGKDLAELDIRAVRRQMGIVLQSSNLLAGDILTNIIGSLPLTVEDAMEAVRMAGLEADIKAMPMGLYTVISQGGGNFSGGQRQRLMIARAIANRPRIVFFDEATSALDNRAQAIVSESLQHLNATRIVIAHRLSTIIKADRIIVMDRGVIVQSGTYQQLSSQPGMFAELAKRQSM